jgi:ATP-dependent exoDNAse (exonuclease V) beta subunit
VEVARFTGEKPEPGLESEFIVMQGVADLVVLLRDEIRVVDFKTDALRPGELSGKTTLYAPQLKVYACALARIYRRPVSECWLHFLHVRQSVQIGMVDLRCET